MEQIQNNRVITDLYRENAQFPGIALDGSDEIGRASCRERVSMFV